MGTLSTATVTTLMIFAPIFVVFGLILMIGCANVANLLLARGVSRQRLAIFAMRSILLS